MELWGFCLAAGCLIVFCIALMTLAVGEALEDEPAGLSFGLVIAAIGFAVLAARCIVMAAVGK